MRGDNALSHGQCRFHGDRNVDFSGSGGQEGRYQKVVESLEVDDRSVCEGSLPALFADLRRLDSQNERCISPDLPTASGSAWVKSTRTSTTSTSVTLRCPRAWMRPCSTIGAMKETLPANSRPGNAAARTRTGCPILI